MEYLFFATTLLILVFLIVKVALKLVDEIWNLREMRKARKDAKYYRDRSVGGICYNRKTNKIEGSSSFIVPFG